MRPLRLELEGLGSYTRPRSIDLAGLDVVAITGPNGAGKSTLAEAMQIALYGRPGRTRSLDTVMSHGADALRVALDFSHEGHTYRVTRERVRGKKTGASLLALDEVTGSDSELARGVDAVDAALQSMIGVSRDAFLSTSLLAQGDAARFCEADPAKRKALFGELLGLERFAVLAEGAKRKRRGYEAAGGAASQRIGDLDAELAGQPEDAVRAKALAVELEGARAALERATRDNEAAAQGAGAVGRLEAELARLEAELARRRKAEESQLHEAQQRARSADTALASADRALGVLQQRVSAGQLATDSIARIEAELRSAEGERARLLAEVEQIMEAGRRARSDGERLGAERTRLETEVAAVQERLDVVTKHPDDAQCYACGQELSPEHRATLEGELRTQVAELSEAVKHSAEGAVAAEKERGRLRGVLHQLQGQVAGAEKEVREATAALAKATAAASSLADATSELEAAEEAVARATADRDAAVAAVVMAEGHKTELTDLAAGRDELKRELEAAVRDAAGLAEAKARLAETTALVAKLTAETGALEERLRRYDVVAGLLSQAKATEAEMSAKARRSAVLERAYGKDGVPLLVVQGALAELEADIADVLGRLADSGLVVRLVTRRETLAGSSAETLDIVVEAEGEERPFELFSGGERLRLSLAVSSALARLMRRRAGGGVDMLFFDEPSALDADGVRALVDWLCLC
ncbi:MAG: SMC family ATPase, partial [Actinobacteria bacterium]|nr:SMC family ATPase [Actinomycetota bacterium]